MKNIDVAEAFARRQPARAGHFHTDGTRVYSYALLVGEHKPDGTVWLLNRTDSPSVTTTRHVNLVRRAVG